VGGGKDFGGVESGMTVIEDGAQNGKASRGGMRRYEADHMSNVGEWQRASCDESQMEESENPNIKLLQLRNPFSFVSHSYLALCIHSLTCNPMDDPKPSYTVLRIKRKATEAPLSSLGQSKPRSVCFPLLLASPGPAVQARSRQTC